jgi:NOL1/NOP2/fmu family ribosome biogenesis protein
MWIADELGAESLLDGDQLPLASGVISTEHGYSLVPGHVEGEGQYCAALRKVSGSDLEYRPAGKQRSQRPSSKEQPLPKGIDGFLNRKVVMRQKADTVTAVPALLAEYVAMLEQELHVISAGCAVGTLKGQILVPDADLALSLMFDRSAFPYVELGLQDALAYLHRDAIMLDAPKGYVVVGYRNLPLGFVKNLGNRCNNLHPQSRRIRMNIPKEI